MKIDQIIKESVQNESAYEADLDDNEPRIVSGVYGAKSKEFRKKFANQRAQDRFFDHPDREGNFEIHYVQRAGVREDKSENRELWDKIKSKGVTPGFDRERYTDMSDQGLEGPFRMKNGQVLYYDSKEGKYYNRDTDMYVDYDEYRAMDEAAGKAGRTAAQIRAEINKIEDRMEDIQNDGGRILQNDPLMIKLKGLRAELTKAKQIKENYTAASKKAEASRQRAIKRAAAAYKRHGDMDRAIKDHDLFAKDAAKIKSLAGDKVEEQQLDELSKDTLKSYLQKKKDGTGKDYPTPLAFRKAMLSTGIAKAKLGKNPKRSTLPDVSVMASGRRGAPKSNKVEEQQLDELSPKTLKSYANKAKKEYDRISGDEDVHPNEYMGPGNTHDKRAKGINMANRKLKKQEQIEEKFVVVDGDKKILHVHGTLGAANKRAQSKGLDPEEHVMTHSYWQDMHGPRSKRNKDAANEGIVDKIKGAVRREKAKDLPLVQTRRDYAMDKGGEAYNKGETRKGDQYMAYAEKDRKKKGDPTTNPAGTYRTKTSDYANEAAGQKYEMRFKNGKTQRFVADTPEEARKKAKGLGATSLIKVSKDGMPQGKVAEGDKRPAYVVSTKDKPKKVKPTRGGSSPHPYQGKLVGENSDFGEPRDVLAGVLQTLEREVEWPLTDIMDPQQVKRLLSPLMQAISQHLNSLDD
jgi:hypothetical protein